ncbi:putative nuclear polyadenylated RNA-binding protein NAB2 [Monocercomonoides exilis]|uniref:putative nuclear polyadenylated RNA-binding protein NAB2 n=1 Tax=Monocercomonoides exilis TaxID=2049356 RepID=UPI0035596F1A|nr:putative nuclear polyadenylated RNA-binding protein NAB2 [Monocercomonoides exilis]
MSSETITPRPLTDAEILELTERVKAVQKDYYMDGDTDFLDYVITMVQLNKTIESLHESLESAMEGDHLQFAAWLQSTIIDIISSEQPQNSKQKTSQPQECASKIDESAKCCEHADASRDEAITDKNSQSITLSSSSNTSPKESEQVTHSYTKTTSQITSELPKESSLYSKETKAPTTPPPLKESISLTETTESIAKTPSRTLQLTQVSSPESEIEKRKRRFNIETKSSTSDAPMTNSNQGALLNMPKKRLLGLNSAHQKREGEGEEEQDGEADNASSNSQYMPQKRIRQEGMLLKQLPSPPANMTSAQPGQAGQATQYQHQPLRSQYPYSSPPPQQPASHPPQTISLPPYRQSQPLFQDHFPTQVPRKGTTSMQLPQNTQMRTSTNSAFHPQPAAPSTAAAQTTAGALPALPTQTAQTAQAAASQASPQMQHTQQHQATYQQQPLINSAQKQPLQTYQQTAPAHQQYQPVQKSSSYCPRGASCRVPGCPMVHPIPPCRYQDMCTNPNCSFNHNPPCRLGASCTVPFCLFSHYATMEERPLCYYGINCTNPKCTFRHPPGHTALAASWKQPHYQMQNQQQASQNAQPAKQMPSTTQSFTDQQQTSSTNNQPASSAQTYDASSYQSPVQYQQSLQHPISAAQQQSS